MAKLDIFQSDNREFDKLENLSQALGRKEIGSSDLVDHWKLLKGYYGEGGSISEIFEVKDGKIKILDSKAAYYEKNGKDSNGNINNKAFEALKPALKKKNKNLPDNVIDFTVNLIKAVFEIGLKDLQDEVLASQQGIEGDKGLFKSFLDSVGEFDRYARDLQSTWGDVFTLSSRHYLKDEEKLQKGNELKRRHAETMKYIKLIKSHPNYGAWSISNGQENQALNDFIFKSANYFLGKDEIENSHWEDSVKSIELAFELLGKKDKKGEDFNFQTLPSLDDVFNKFKHDERAKNILRQQLNQGKTIGEIMDNPEVKGAFGNFYQEAFGSFEKDTTSKIITLKGKVDNRGSNEIFTNDQIRSINLLYDMLIKGDGFMGLNYRQEKQFNAMAKFAPAVLVGVLASIPTMGSSSLLVIGSGAVIGGVATTGVNAMIQGEGDIDQLVTDAILNSATMGAGRVGAWAVRGRKAAKDVGMIRNGLAGVAEGTLDVSTGAASDFVRALMHDEYITWDEAFKANLAWALVPIMPFAGKGMKKGYEAARQQLGKKTIERLWRYKIMKLIGDPEGANAELNAIKTDIEKTAKIRDLDLQDKIEDLDKSIKQRKKDLAPEFDKVPDPSKLSSDIHINKLKDIYLNKGDKIRLMYGDGTSRIYQLISWDKDTKKAVFGYKDHLNRPQELTVSISGVTKSNQIKVDLNDPLFKGHSIDTFGVSSHPNLNSTFRVGSKSFNELLKDLDEEIQALAKAEEVQKYLRADMPAGMPYISAIMADVKSIKAVRAALIEDIAKNTSSKPLTIGDYKIRTVGKDKYAVFDKSGTSIENSKNPEDLLKFLEKNEKVNLIAELSGEQLITYRLGGNMGDIMKIDPDKRVLKLGDRKIRFGYESGNIVYDDLTNPTNINRINLSSSTDLADKVFKSDIDLQIYLRIITELK